jgi:HK97 family phage prohead protease
MSTTTGTRVKTARAAIKATGGDAGTDLAEGQFRALVSVFGNVDSTGDKVMPGAFANTLKAWEDKGDPIPVIWSHDWSNPFAHIGHVVKATETDDGLEVHGQLDVDGDNPLAAQVYRLMKGRRVTQFSFAYDVLDGGWGKARRKDDHEEDDGEDDSGDEPEDVFELRELALYEVGPCLLGVNQSTDLLDVKALVAAEVKAALAVITNPTNPGGQPPVKQGSSQGSAPRDDGPGRIPTPSNPPGMTSASIHALITTQLPEGI